MTFYQACGSRHHHWPHVEAFYDRTWGAFQMRMHTHTWCEVMYVFSGACEIVYGDDITLRLRSGDYIFFDAGVPHRLLTQEDIPCTMLNVEFSFAPSDDVFSLRQLAAQSGELAGMLHAGEAVLRGNDLRGQLFRAMDLLLQSLCTGQQKDHVLVRTEMMLFLLRLAQVVQENRQLVGTVRYVKQAVAYIQHHFSEQLTLPRLAQNAGIHPDYLSHLFKAYTGETPMRYLARIRNDHAATLLLRSTLTLDSIAQEAGYASRQQLARSFKQQFGISPMAYRKRH